MIKISNKKIGSTCPIFLVAEAGINHNGRLSIAKKLISEAKNVGSDAIKFQTFKAEDLASPNSQYFKLFKKVELSKSDFAELSDYSKSEGIIFLSTPFSNDAIDILTKLNVPCFKIASGDLTNIPLIEYAASKKKPIILSTGMSNIIEIKQAINAVKISKNNKIIILHSVSGYPTPYYETNLNAIRYLEKMFGYPTGYSDNGDEELVPLTAAAVGATMIEKHFTLNRKMIGPDHKMSSDPSHLKKIITNIRKIEEMLGSEEKKVQSSEKSVRRNARRSLIALTTIEKGSLIKKEMIGIKRPATGLEPKFLKNILGKKTKKKINTGKYIQWNDLK